MGIIRDADCHAVVQKGENLSSRPDTDRDDLDGYDVTFGGATQRWQTLSTGRIRVLDVEHDEDTMQGMGNRLQDRISDGFDDHLESAPTEEVEKLSSNKVAGTEPPTPAKSAATPQLAYQTTIRTQALVPHAGELIADRYCIVKSLGSGSMGEVFEVKHARLGKSFALKILKPILSRDRVMRMAFFREAKFASSLEHPNLVSVLDYGEAQTHGAYMVMELVPGEQLSSYLAERGTLSVKRSCDIILQVADALAYVHSQQQIHCDLKPENIILTKPTGKSRRGLTIKLLDFGLAQVRQASEPDDGNQSPAYVAPEVANFQEPTEVSDVYSIGILFFLLLTGELPWTGAVSRVLSAHIDEDPPSLSARGDAEFDIALETLIQKALHKKPRDRQPSVSAFIYELKNFMQMTGLMQSRKVSRNTQEVRQNDAERISKRAQYANASFDALHLPLATISADGKIVAANQAFSQFVLGIRAGIEGTLLHDTSLAETWPTMQADIATACTGELVRRRVEIDVTPTQCSTLQMCIEPTTKRDFVALSLYPGGPPEAT